ncbi:MAG: hypothetical protein Q9162_003395 [Coniocarpon cinnabarinum]
MDLYGSQSSMEHVLSFPLDQISNDDFFFNADPRVPLEPQPSEPLPRESCVQISMDDFVERLAYHAVCLGGPGPGFLPGDIDMMLDKLVVPPSNMLVHAA